MIAISNQTKVSVIIKANPESIDLIASLATPFQKLKNPILRRLLAPRVTLAQAASIGGCDLNTMRNALASIGFQFTDTNGFDQNITAMENKPAWLLELTEDQIQTLDVRPIINASQDPLKEIIQQFNDLSTGDALCIINSFVPYPLIHLLAKESISFTMETEPMIHHTWFLKNVKPEAPKNPSQQEKSFIMENQDSFNEVLGRFEEDQIQKLDVRNLPMPEPMDTILAHLNKLPVTHVIYVRHRRIPIHLFDQLLELSYSIHVFQLKSEDVYLLIYKS